MTCGRCRRAHTSGGRASVRLIAGLLLALIAIASGWILYVRGESHDASAQLATLAHAPRDHRVIEARLAGFTWAPFDERRSCEGRCASADQMIAAASLLASLENDTTPEARHAVAVARLVTDGPTKALDALRLIPADQFDPAMWSDRSAAAIGSARRENRPSLLVNAITSADRALEIDPSFAPARFNRALAIERLGLRDAAATAWKDYLATEPAGAWSDEARSHLRNVFPPLPRFKDLIARDRDRIGHGDLPAAGRLAALFPAETRIYALTDGLGTWGEELDRNVTNANMSLAVARNLGRALAVRGDVLVADCVAAIDASAQPQRQILARGHAAFGRGRKELPVSPTSAAPALHESSVVLAHSAGPMTFVARYVHAISLFDQGYLSDSRRELEAVLREIPERQQSLRAQVLWQLGLCYGATSEWGATLRVLKESVSLFERAGDPYDAAVVSQILTEVYDVIGDHDTAWKTRVAVLQEIGRTTNLRTETAVSGISYAAAQQQNWRLALSVLNIEIAIASQVRHGPSELDAYMRRAVANREMGRREAAASDLQNARRVTAALKDPALRSRGNADILAAEALNATTPQEAVVRLTHAIDFHRTQGRALYVPTFLLERARAFQRMGDSDRARADIEAGIARLEQDRQTLPDAATRLGIFDAGAELFTAAIEDAMSRRDVTAAFAYAERARARSLLDAVDPANRAAAAIDRARVPANTAIVEYVTLPKRLVAFVLTREELTLVASPVSPQVLASDAGRFRGDVAAGRDPGVVSRRLYSRLIKPIETLIRSKPEVVFVPDATLASLPFAALSESQRHFFIDDHSVVMAPSAAIHLAAVARGEERHGTNDVLVIAASAPGDAAALRGAEQEASAVARIYPHATTLSREHATTAAFVSKASDAEVIHFAGHALSAADDGAPTSLVISGGAAGRLDLDRIQSLMLRDTSVVVLAACNSARGEVHWSEGTLSVARAFLAAGAPTVIATLWEIDDRRSAEFFTRLHEHLAAGTSPADALRATQIEWARRPGSTASQWAAIQAIGR